LPTGEILPPGAVPIHPQQNSHAIVPAAINALPSSVSPPQNTSIHNHSNNAATHQHKSKYPHGQNTSSQQTIPTLAPEIDTTQQSVFDVGPTADITDPTQVIDLNGKSDTVTESSDFVVPTRVLIPHVNAPEQHSIPQPFQSKVLSAEQLNSHDIIPFEPEPEVEPQLPIAPACPVDFDDELPLKLPLKKGKHKKQEKKQSADDSQDSDTKSKKGGKKKKSKSKKKKKGKQSTNESQSDSESSDDSSSATTADANIQSSDE
jgi:hypothetical protein